MTDKVEVEEEQSKTLEIRVTYYDEDTNQTLRTAVLLHQGTYDLALDKVHYLGTLVRPHVDAVIQKIQEGAPEPKSNGTIIMPSKRVLT